MQNVMKNEAHKGVQNYYYIFKEVRWSFLAMRQEKKSR